MPRRRPPRDVHVDLAFVEPGENDTRDGKWTWKGADRSFTACTFAIVFAQWTIRIGIPN